MSSSSRPWSAIGALADPVRRRLYEYVVASAEPVSREQAARGADVPLHSARFHLDRLVEEGLLVADQRRLTGRSGPGAGRPAKVYRRAPGAVAVSLPGREYDLVGRIMAAAVQRSLDGAPLAEVLTEEARATGRADGARAADAPDEGPDQSPDERPDDNADGAGAEASRDHDPGPGPDELDRAAAVLARRGFEPTRSASDVVLRNCPFDALAREHTALVCGVNLDYVSGVVEGAGCRRVRAELDPGEDRCCVRLVAEES
jgi:predicted ArsR family transcriptional regulator